MIINVKIFLYDKKVHEHTGKYEEIEARMSIMLSEVEKWSETFRDDDETVHPKRCCVYFKSGDTVIIGMSFDEFDAVMHKFARQLFLTPVQLQ